MACYILVIMGAEEKEQLVHKIRKDETSTRVFVGNLAYSTTWQDLKDHMRLGDCEKSPPRATPAI